MGCSVGKQPRQDKEIQKQEKFKNLQLQKAQNLIIQISKQQKNEEIQQVKLVQEQQKSYRYDQDDKNSKFQQKSFNEETERSGEESLVKLSRQHRKKCLQVAKQTLLLEIQQQEQKRKQKNQQLQAHNEMARSMVVKKQSMMDSGKTNFRVFMNYSAQQPRVFVQLQEQVNKKQLVEQQKVKQYNTKLIKDQINKSMDSLSIECVESPKHNQSENNQEIIKNNQLKKFNNFNQKSQQSTTDICQQSETQIDIDIDEY